MSQAPSASPASVEYEECMWVPARASSAGTASARSSPQRVAGREKEGAKRMGGSSETAEAAGRSTGGFTLRWTAAGRRTLNEPRAPGTALGRPTPAPGDVTRDALSSPAHDHRAFESPHD